MAQKKKICDLKLFNTQMAGILKLNQFKVTALGVRHDVLGRQFFFL